MAHLAKMVSGQEPTLVGVFTCDQHQPSIRFEESGDDGNKPPAPGSGTGDDDKPPAPSSEASLPAGQWEPEVMEIDEGEDKEEDEESNDDHEARADPIPDWRIPYLDYLIQEILPMDKYEAR
jgi:hypothetical protein